MDTRLLALLLFLLRLQEWKVLGTTVPPDAPITAPINATCETWQFSPEAKQAVGSAIMKLGLQLLENLKPGLDQPNVIVSPLSISLALSQLALGAVNETKAMLLHSLHADTLPCYQWALQSLVRHLEGAALQVASRIYVQPGFEVKPAFVEESVRMYSSEPVSLTCLEEVNEWVKNATNGQVTNFLSSLPPQVVLMLVNAVHFKGEWQARFDPRLTSREPFYIDGKNAVHVDMMKGPKYPLSLLVDTELGAQVARFPFKEQLSLLVVMPMSGKVNVTALAARLSLSELYARLPRETNMQVKLPKFKLEYDQELRDALASMGLRQLFSSPDFSGIADGPLQVSSVRHKSSLELHEEGAEAAAATAVIINRSNPTFTVNQPFFFALVDDKTYTPVFLGVIANPNPGAVAMQNDSPGNGTLPFVDSSHFDGSPE